MAYDEETEVSEGLLPLFFGLHALGAAEEEDCERLERVLAHGDGRAASKAGRPDDNPEWAYGEVLPGPFATFLREQRQEQMAGGSDVSGGFVDLGSGTGCAVLTAALFGDFEWCLGLEILPELDSIAQSSLASCQAEWPGVRWSVDLRCADIFEVAWWQGAAIVFCNAATWPLAMRERLGAAAAGLRPGARLLVAHERSLPLRSRAGQFHVSRAACDCDWRAQMPVWVHERVGAQPADEEHSSEGLAGSD